MEGNFAVIVVLFIPLIIVGFESRQRHYSNLHNISQM
ncbi:YjcZ family sporulation protein [Bacillus sp. X1(2014)]